jgi:hypothetical protein
MDLGMAILGLASRSPEEGAETLVWLAASPDVATVSGGYFFDRRQKQPSREGQDAAAARRLWEASEEQCAGSGPLAKARA